MAGNVQQSAAVILRLGMMQQEISEQVEMDGVCST
jgi:hypothetical protein